MKTVVHLSKTDPALHEAVVGNVRGLLADETLTHEAVAFVAGGGIGLVRKDPLQRNGIEALAAEGWRSKPAGTPWEVATPTG